MHKPANLFSWLNFDMPTLIERLEEIMSTEQWDYGALVDASGETRSVVSQWLGRGSKVIHSIGKMEAAERLEAASRFNSLWIAKGQGLKFKSPAPTATAASPATDRVSLDDALDVLRIALEGIDPTKREALATSLAGWAREGGKDHWRDMVRLLLTEVVLEKRAA